MQQKIAEIGGVQFLEALLVLGIKRRAFVIKGRAFGGGQVLGRQRAVFPAVDDRGQLARGPAFVVDIGGLKQLFDQADLVVGVEDGEIGFQAHQFGMTAQKLDADGMEGAQPGHPLDRLPHHRAHTVFHLARGLVGKGHGEDFVGTRTARLQQMRDAGGQGAGLARACPGQHQHRPLDLFDRGALFGVQPVEIGRGPRRHRLLAEGWGRRRLEGIVFVKAAHDIYMYRSTARIKRV